MKRKETMRSFGADGIPLEYAAISYWEKRSCFVRAASPEADGHSQSVDVVGPLGSGTAVNEEWARYRGIDNRFDA